MNEDITTGQQQLSGARNQDLYPQTSTDLPISQELSDKLTRLNKQARQRNYEVAHGHVGYEGLRNPSLYKPERTDLEYGSSKYDEGLMVDATQEDITNKRASSQSGLAKLGAGTAKMGILAGTTFAVSTVGLAEGLGTMAVRGFQAMTDDDSKHDASWALSGFWDTNTNNLAQRINQASEEVFKNYYNTEEASNPWYNNVGTMNFWADGILKNMGFTIGAIGAGALTGGWLAGALAKVPGGAVATRVLSTAVSAAGEGAQEALNTANDSRKTSNYMIEQDFALEKQNLDLKYKKLTDNLRATPDSLYVQKGLDGNNITVSRNAQIFESLRNNYEQELQQLKDTKASRQEEADKLALSAGNWTMGANMAILSLTNSLEFGNTLSGGFANAKKSAALLARNKETKEVIKGAKNIAKGIQEGTLEFEARKGLGKEIAKNIAVKGASEGFEEGSQNFASNTFQIDAARKLNTFAGHKINPYVQDDVNNMMDAANQALQEQYGTPESPGWQEVAMGSIGGILGVPILKRGGKYGVKGAWAGGIMESVEEAKQKFAANQVVEQVNQAITNPNFLNRYQGLIRHNSFQALMDEAVKNNNEYEYKDSEHAQLVSDIIMFRKANQLESLKEMNKGLSEISDEDVDNIKKANIVPGTTQSKLEGESNESIKAGVVDRAKKVNKFIDDVEALHNAHLVKYGDTHSDDALEELTWTAASMINHQDRFEENIKNLSKLLNPIIETMDDSELVDKDGNSIKELLLNDPRILYKTLTNMSNGLYGTLVKTLKGNKERYQELLKEVAILENDQKFAEKKGKSNKVHKLQGQIDKLSKVIQDIKDSGNVMESEDLAKSFTDAMASAIKVNHLNNKYKELIDSPEKLDSELAKDKETSTKGSDNIQQQKANEGIFKATTMDGFKKALAALPMDKRNSMLQRLVKEDTPIGEFARKLKGIEDAHATFEDILQGDMVEGLDDNAKADLRRAFNEAAATAKGPVGFLTQAEALTSAEYRKFIDPIVKIYKENLEASKKTKGNEDKKDEQEATPQIIPQPEVNPAPQPEPKSEETPADETPVEETPEEVPEEVQEETPTPEVELTDEEKEIEEAEKQAKLEAEKAAQKAAEPAAEFTGVTDDMEEILDEILNNRNPYDETEVRSDGLTQANIVAMLRKNGKVFQETLGTDNNRYDTLINYLMQADAFDFVDLGHLADLLEKNPNLKIHFIVDKVLNSRIKGRDKKSAAGDAVLMAVEADTPHAVEVNGKKYQIVGTLKIKSTSANSIEIKKRVLQESNNSKDNVVVASIHSTIAHIYPGRIATSFSGNTQNGIINSIPKSEFDKAEEEKLKKDGKPLPNRRRKSDRVVKRTPNTYFGILLQNNQVFAPNVPNKEKIISPVTDKNLSGLPVMMIKGADGNYYSVALKPKTFSYIVGQKQTNLYHTIEGLLNTIVDTDPNNTVATRLTARDKLENYIHFGKKNGNGVEGNVGFELTIHSNKLGQQFIQLTRVSGEDEQGNKIYESYVDKDGHKMALNLVGNVEEDTNNLIEFLAKIDPLFNFSTSMLADEEYVNEMINAQVFTTDTIANRTFISNFKINEIDEEGNPVEETPEVIETSTPTEKPDNPLSNAPKQESVIYNGKEYTIDEAGIVRGSDGQKISHNMSILISLQYQIQQEKGIINKIENAVYTFYVLNNGSENIGAQVDKRTGRTQFTFGDAVQKELDLMNKSVQGNANAVANAIDNSNLNSDAKVLQTEGFNPMVHRMQIENREEQGTYLTITSINNGDILYSEPLTTTQFKTLYEALKDHQEDSDAVQVEIAAPFIKEIVLDTLNKKVALKAEIDKKTAKPASKEIISDKDWNDFVDNNIVSDSILQTIADKVKTRSSDLTERETAIYQTRTSDIEQLISVNKPETSENNQENWRENSIFDTMPPSSLKAIRQALRNKDIVASTKVSIEKSVKELLGLSNVELSAMTVDGIISEINCK